jgi:hypothetical protein
MLMRVKPHGPNAQVEIISRSSGDPKSRPIMNVTLSRLPVRTRSCVSGTAIVTRESAASESQKHLANFLGQILRESARGLALSLGTTRSGGLASPRPRNATGYPPLRFRAGLVGRLPRSLTLNEQGFGFIEAEQGAEDIGKEPALLGAGVFLQ